MMRCFACDKPLGKNPPLADTRDSQIVFVGMECFRRVVASGAAGYQPPKGGPRLWTIPRSLSQAEINALHISAESHAKSVAH